MTPLATLATSHAHGANTPLLTALFFALAGGFFLGIYFLHRIRRKKALLKLHLRAQASRAASQLNADR